MKIILHKRKPGKKKGYSAEKWKQCGYKYKKYKKCYITNANKRPRKRQRIRRKR